LMLAIAVSAPTTIRAEAPGKVDMEAAEMAAELIGAPVFCTDGSEVGEVADILFNEENEPPWGLRVQLDFREATMACFVEACTGRIEVAALVHYPNGDQNHVAIRPSAPISRIVAIQS
jgi:hypothetical protein